MIDRLLDKITVSFRAAFPVSELPGCEMFPRLERSIEAPALLFEVTDITPAEDPGTDELALNVRLAAYAVTGLYEEAADRAAMSLAISAALHIHQARNFGAAGVGRARLEKLGPEEFKPDLVGYAAWAVEWSHLVILGQSVWELGGLVPSQVLLGYSPDIGLPHKPDYEPIEGLPNV